MRGRGQHNQTRFSSVTSEERQTGSKLVQLRHRLGSWGNAYMMVRLAPCPLGGSSNITSPMSDASASRITPQHIGIRWFGPRHPKVLNEWKPPESQNLTPIWRAGRTSLSTNPVGKAELRPT